jgi:hypothetical protein
LATPLSALPTAVESGAIFMISETEIFEPQHYEAVRRPLLEAETLSIWCYTRPAIAGKSNVFGGRSALASSIAAQMVAFVASPQAIIPKNGVDRDLTDFDFVVLEP